MEREKIIVRNSLYGILLNFLLAGIKVLIGVFSGSVSVMLDGVNNLTDMLSAVVTLVGAKIARKGPDKEHPFGHGRMEYLATVGVGLVILFAGASAMYGSVPKIIHPELADYSIFVLVFIVFAVVTKLVFGRYLKKTGKKHHSRSLEATGIDAMYDALLSFGTLVGAVVSMVFGLSIDGIIGAVIAIFIIRTGLEVTRDGLNDILGRRADVKFSRKIIQVIEDFSEVREVKELELHDYGPTGMFGTVRIGVPEGMLVKDFGKLTRKIEEEVFSKFQVRLTIGVFLKGGKK
ncbi:cation transporter [Candidatus Saccharibacteria bacterium]|nr:cation transporter [Candidatus Saccharibacteria bacterium]